jgi:hypothetical protein
MFRWTDTNRPLKSMSPHWDGQLLTEPEPRPKRQQNPRIPPREVSLRDLDQVGSFRSCQRLYLCFQLVTATEISAHTQRRIGGNLLVLDSLG